MFPPTVVVPLAPVLEGLEALISEKSPVRQSPRQALMHDAEHALVAVGVGRAPFSSTNLVLGVAEHVARALTGLVAEG